MKSLRRSAASVGIAVIVVGGDLGPDFPLGRGASLASGTFRVVALRDHGLPTALRQLAAARDGAILDEPARYGCLVRDAREMLVRPEAGSRASDPLLMVNIDGLSHLSRGPLRFSVSGSVKLILGPGHEC